MSKTNKLALIPVMLCFFAMGFVDFLTSSLKKHVFYNWLINSILYLCVT